MATPIRAPSLPFALAGFGSAVGIVAVIGASFGGGAKETYAALRLPDWAPPSWLFGPMWTVVYALMALSGWLYWRAGGSKTGVAVYGFGLLLNAAWVPLFFGAGMAVYALLDILALNLVVLVTAWLFFRRSRLAALFQGIYLLWLVYTAALNLAVVILN
ncbi:tryptophan-rich sensory protein [Allokutzneria sp. A3M-2-11 16]|uniref:TspO/MBR family protein n=1 Tax=Allokutzneria sp. A3M-2-11 16 TaxID=2962043 RepID=UPI0020B7C8BC|nr:TspO/MBR family protein [Allokutzneria sp. A3M-2-11 16]MCP3802235.1 tryptophan-rich sensory protein [Allokutzneria sp. A3M-2-11 16]